MDKINDTTWGKEIKSNPKDRIEIIVGDDKQADFKPQVKIQRWDNEVNFSIRAEEKAGATIEEKDGVIKYITPEYEVHQYEKPNAGEDGGFEFEWVLNSLPSTNILTATIQTKELDFFYQPPLTPEEIEAEVGRPENVVGSYAVYHKTKGRLNDSSGMQYKTGKAFHIYRPKAIDSNGIEEWCDLNIDEQNGILSVTIPQKFLDDAVYPVKVDPTFGYTSLGASRTNIARGTAGGPRSIRVGNAITGANGFLDAIDLGIDTTVAETLDVTALINVENAGTDSHSLVAKIERTDLSVTTTEAFFTFTAGGQSLTAISYVLNAIGDGNDTAFGTDVSVCFDASGSRNNYTEAYDGNYTTGRDEDPWTAVESSTSTLLSIYATYSSFTPTPMMHMMAQAGGLI